MATHFLNNSVKKFLNSIADKWNPDGHWRLPSEAYTLEHKLAFLEREHYLTGCNTLSGWLHDSDKLFLYAVPWLDEKQIQKFHRTHQTHHVDCPQSTAEQLIQTYIDWDCAVLTKPDKPLNAFATLIHFYRDKLPLMLPVCLAIDPDAVQPMIADLDKARKEGNASYIFGEKMNDEAHQDLTEFTHNLFNYKLARDASNDVTYIHTQRLIGSIVHDLNEIMNDMQKYHKNIKDVLCRIPKQLTLMNSADLFLKTLDILAKRRNQQIDLGKCLEVLKNKHLFFTQMAPKFKVECKPSEFMHNYRSIMPNPFLHD